MQLHFVVHGVGPVLLVLSRCGLPRHNLHFHSAGQEQLLPLVLLLLLLYLLLLLLRLLRLLALHGVYTAIRTHRSCHHVVLHRLGQALDGVVVGDSGRVSLGLVMVVLVQLVDV